MGPRLRRPGPEIDDRYRHQDDGAGERPPATKTSERLPRADTLTGGPPSRWHRCTRTSSDTSSPQARSASAATALSVARRRAAPGRRRWCRLASARRWLPRTWPAAQSRPAPSPRRTAKAWHRFPLAGLSPSARRHDGRSTPAAQDPGSPGRGRTGLASQAGSEALRSKRRRRPCRVTPPICLR